MSAARLLARVGPTRVSINIEMEQQLTQSRLLGVAAHEADAEIRAGADGLAQLFDPRGRRHIICRSGFAAKWCSENADWTFEALS